MLNITFEVVELFGFAPVDGGGTRATNPGAEVTREGATWHKRSRAGGGSDTVPGGISGFFADPALSDLVDDRTQSGAVLVIPFWTERPPEAEDSQWSA